VTGAPTGVTPVCTPAAPVAWLAVGSSIHCTVTFTPTSTAPLTLTVTAGTASQDADHTNDAQSVTITPVAPIADMQGIALTAVSATVGTPVTVSFSCANNGPDGAVNATCVVSGAPAGVTPVCTPTVPVASLAVNSSITCTVTFTPASTDTLTLKVTAGTDSQDADHTNDTQSVNITPVAGQSAGLPATPVPTLTDIALILLTFLLGVSAVVVHRRGR
jgi:hypothetical protein